MMTLRTNNEALMLLHMQGKFGFTREMKPARNLSFSKTIISKNSYFWAQNTTFSYFFKTILHNHEKKFYKIFRAAKLWQDFRSFMVNHLRIENSVKHQWWSFLRKQLMVESRYFRRKLHLRCLTRFWMRVWSTISVEEN